MSFYNVDGNLGDNSFESNHQRFSSNEMEGNKTFMKTKRRNFNQDNHDLSFQNHNY